MDQFRSGMILNTTVISQPTYLPWVGYFDLIDQSDCVVFLDSVQFEKRGWQQRNRLKGSDRILWLTVPVKTKGRRDQKIMDVEIDQSQSYTDKHLSSITHYYRKAPFFDDYIAGITRILAKSHRQLADLNLELIGWLCECFGIKKKMVRSSLLGKDTRRTELLVEICKAMDADVYLSTPGSREYIEEDGLFGSSGVEVVYHRYEPSSYRQLHGEFMPYLSALDLLLNEGPASLEIIRAGRRRPEVSDADDATLSDVHS